jgi:hypothetical protein
LALSAAMPNSNTPCYNDSVLSTNPACHFDQREKSQGQQPIEISLSVRYDTKKLNLNQTTLGFTIQPFTTNLLPLFFRRFP